MGGFQAAGWHWKTFVFLKNHSSWCVKTEVRVKSKWEQGEWEGAVFSVEVGDQDGLDSHSSSTGRDKWRNLQIFCRNTEQLASWPAVWGWGLKVDTHVSGWSSCGQWHPWPGLGWVLCVHYLKPWWLPWQQLVLTSFYKWETQRHQGTCKKLHSLWMMKPVFEPMAVCKVHCTLSFDFSARSPQCPSCWIQIPVAPLCQSILSVVLGLSVCSKSLSCLESSMPYFRFHLASPSPSLESQTWFSSSCYLLSWCPSNFTAITGPIVWFPHWTISLWSQDIPTVSITAPLNLAQFLKLFSNNSVNICYMNF